MFRVTFPADMGQQYYNLHFKYVLNILKELDCQITIEERPAFTVTIGKKTFLMDFADTNDVARTTLPVFKFHCHEETDNVFAFPPVSFHNWKQYELLLDGVKYKAEGVLSNRQRAYGNAKSRRSALKMLLQMRYPDTRTEQIPRIKYLQEVEDTFIAIFSPGWCNNMLDRAQFQYMGLGCCTMSPRLPEILPFGKTLVPGIHYIMCKDDYSDVPDLVEFFRETPNACIEIGNNAKELFQEIAIPRSIGKWIKRKL